MWKSLSVEDQEQRSAVCLWVCVCVWLLQHLWANKEQDVDYPRTTSVWCCWSPHSTVHYWHKHAYSGWKLHRKLTTTYIFKAVERVLIQHIFRTLLCPVLLEMHTHTSLSMLYLFIFYFGTLGWLFIRCTLVETCKTNILTATRHFKFHSLSVILSL